MTTHSQRLVATVKIDEDLWRDLMHIETATKYRIMVAKEFIDTGQRESAAKTLDELEDHMRSELLRLFKELTGP